MAARCFNSNATAARVGAGRAARFGYSIGGSGGSLGSGSATTEGSKAMKRAMGTSALSGPVFTPVFLIS
jgi:hypothetical protein